MIHHLQDTISAPFQAKTAAAGIRAFTFFNRLKAYSLPNGPVLRNLFANSINSTYFRGIT